MAGGTGGHVFPGLAVAQYLRDQGVEVHWLGTAQGLEARLVPEADIPLHVITITGVRGKGWQTKLLAPFKILHAVWQSLKLIRAVHPDVVLGMGGFASGPGGAAAWLLRCPLVIHEQNARAGMTNRLLSVVADKVLEGFPHTFSAQTKVVYVGNPVRQAIEVLPLPDKRLLPARGRCRLLILGGSLGAQALNELVPHALARLQPDERPEIRHQTGDKHHEETKKLYKSMGMEADLVPFIKEMAEAYTWADVVICRAGALTIAELCAAGLGAVLVPYPFAVDDHQTANAEFMVRGQAAICWQQKDLTAEALADIVRQLIKSPERRLSMAQAAYQLRRERVAEKIGQICEEVCR